MRSALRAGAKVLREEARANVPVALGALRKSIRISTGAKAGQVTASVKAGSRKAWYWRFVEFGTAAHLIAARNARALSLGDVVVERIEHPGATAKPFMRPALDAMSSAALEAVTAQIRKRLTIEGINNPAPEEE
jgi:HK97 gp10 family phage protein